MADGVLSHIPRLIKERGWSQDEWRGHCMLAGLSFHTADRLLEGDTSVTVKTLQRVAKVLAVSSIAELVEFADD